MKKISLVFLLIILLQSIIAQNSTEGYFTDSRDNKQYKTIKIGDNIWMAENLAYKAKIGCWSYNSDEENLKKYGYLYDQPMAKKVCPAGWQLPAKEDFEALLVKLDGAWSDKYNALLPGGGSGFEALFGGYRNAYGRYYDIDKSAYFWSSSSREEAIGWDFYLRSLMKGAFVGSKNKAAAFSVRCIKRK